MTSPSPASALLRTPLYDEHRIAQARLVDFAGWEMPVQYRGIIAEHRTVRESVGLFDLSHMGRLRFGGADVLAFVQHLFTNDVERLTPGRAQYSLCCNERGGIMDDVVVYRLDPEVLVVVNASNRIKLLAHIEHERAYRSSWQVTLRDETFDTAMIGVQGPQAEAYLAPLADCALHEIRYYAGVPGSVAGVAGFIARTGYTGEDGFELIVPGQAAPGLWGTLQQPRADLQPTPCGLGARDTLRLEAGMALYGHELDETINPYQAGLERVVKLDKGEFVGRQALKTLNQRDPETSLVGFELLGGGVPRQGYAVHKGGGAIGAVTSGTMSPTLHKPIGMAYVEADAADVGTDIEIEIRSEPVPARLVALPFYAHRTKRARPPASNTAAR